ARHERSAPPQPHAAHTAAGELQRVRERDGLHVASHQAPVTLTMLRTLLVFSLVAAALPGSARAQALSARGFVDGRLTQFLQEAPGDPEPLLGEVMLRQEVFAKPVSLLQFAGGV